MPSIYTLIDPEDGLVKYVGATTTSLSNRLASHIWQTENRTNKSQKEIWIQDLLNKGLKPIIEELESVQREEQLFDTEKFYISYLRFIGCPLTNVQPGGKGNPKGFKFVKRFEFPKGQQPPHFVGKVTWPKGKKRPLSHYAHKIGVKTGLISPHRESIIAIHKYSGRERAYDCLTDASKDLGISVQYISNVLTGRSAFAHDYHFRYQNKPTKIKTKIKNRSRLIAINDSVCLIYDSILAAAKTHKLDRKKIYKYLNSNIMLDGYTWHRK